MKEPRFNAITAVSITGFVLAILLVALVEILDIPYHLFNTPATPINWTEIGIEVFYIFVVGTFVIFIISKLDLERKRAAESLSKVYRALKTLSECNQILIRATEEPDLLHKICQTIVEEGGYRLAWVGYAEQDEMKTVRPVAQQGFEEGYLDTVNITWAYTEQDHGPAGTAIRTGKSCVVNNIVTASQYAHSHAEATKRDYQSLIALPLLANGQTLGALSIYSAESDAFNADEVRLLTELAGDLAYGIMALRTRVDITERKKMEEQLILTDRLASIGQLASGIAHELNNPLTGVIGFSDLLLEKALPEDVKEDLAIINREAKRTANVVKGLLVFARKQKVEKEPVDINGVIGEVLQLRSYEQRVTNIEVKTRLDSDLPQVVANSAQLQQVFINLIINAEQAMLEAHSRGALTITTERVGDIVRTTFTDDGPGISPENLRRIFTPFFTTKEVGKGTGLGLSICHGIVTSHGGKIYAKSESGKGATFVVELPISSCSEEEQ